MSKKRELTKLETELKTANYDLARKVSELEYNFGLIQAENKDLKLEIAAHKKMAEEARGEANRIYEVWQRSREDMMNIVRWHVLPESAKEQEKAKCHQCGYPQKMADIRCGQCGIRF